MNYYQINITTGIKNNNIIYTWQHEFENKPNILEGWKIESVKYVPKIRRMELEIKRTNSPVVALILVTFLTLDNSKSNLPEKIKDELRIITNAIEPNI